MTYIYNTLKLEKGMYQDGTRSFSQVLESMDPSEGYIGTALEGLDAFQRQLKRFDIKVRGIESDTVEKFFATTESAVLFPEYVARSVRHGIEESDILPMITASTTVYGSTDEVDVTHTKYVKRGRRLAVSYDAIRTQKLDLFSVMLRQIGSHIAHSHLEDAVNTLINGDENSAPADVSSLKDSSATFNYETMLDFWAKFEPFEMNTLLTSNDVALKLLKMPEIQNSLAGFSLLRPGISTPFGATLIRTGAVPEKTAIGIDKRFALEMIQVGSVAVEYDKLIDRQFEYSSITTVSGFSKIYSDASKILLI